MGTATKYKRKHKSYSQSSRKEVVKYAKQAGVPLACLAYDVPKSTISTWMAQEHSKYRFLKNLGWACLWFLVTVVGLVGTALGVCYLSGGPEEAKFMWGFIWDLLTQAGRSSL